MNKMKTDQLTNLNSLTNGQHDALVNDIFNAPTREEVAKRFEKAEQLNNTMKALRDAIKDNQQVLQSSNYKMKTLLNKMLTIKQ